MNVLFVLEHYHPHIGGVERMFQLLAESLVQEGGTATVVTTRYDSTLPAKEELNGVQIVRLNTINRFFFTFFGFFGVVPHAKKCDLIHTTSYNAAVPAYLASLFSGKPAMITFHEVWGKLWFELPFLQGWQRTGYALYEQFILKIPFKRIVAVSDSTKKSLEDHGVRSERITRIYNGINYSDQQKATESSNDRDFTFTYFGRLGVSKGLDLILEAAHQLKSDQISFRLKLILPERPIAIKKRVDTMVKQLSLGEILEFHCELSDQELDEQLLESDAVLVPSYSEGFCFSAVEAIARGLPIISSGKGALAEVVSGRFLEFDPFSSEGLAMAMKKAISGEWQHKPMVRFELAENVQHYRDLYKEILANMPTSNY